MCFVKFDGRERGFAVRGLWADIKKGVYLLVGRIDVFYMRFAEVGETYFWRILSMSSLASVICWSLRVAACLTSSPRWANLSGWFSTTSLR